ncbi:MAG: type II CAAX prenyl endopeptidase Rce1 family protein [Flammeovirgaceae bacterium]
MLNIPFSKSDWRGIDGRVLTVALTSIVCLVAIRYAGSFGDMGELSWFFPGAPYLFRHQAWWALVSVFFYFAVPWAVVRWGFKEMVSKFGLSKNVFSNLPVYLLALMCILPLVVMVSFQPGFQVTYPFFVPTDRADMYLFYWWEGLYLLQFFALEFFFRGFMVHGMKHRLGIYSILVMTIPYCMIHFSKPLPECLGSIGAGLFLGMMSYKTGSIWMGAFLHMVVAVSMDVLSLWHRGYF